MRVLVYGTLKRGGALNRNLEEAKFLGEYITPPEYTMLNIGWFPGVVHAGDTAIHGEVYEITEEILRLLDSVEGYPNLYTREEIETPYGNTWIYLFNSARLELRQYNVIKSGIFPVGD